MYRERTLRARRLCVAPIAQLSRTVGTHTHIQLLISPVPHFDSLARLLIEAQLVRCKKRAHAQQAKYFKLTVAVRARKANGTREIIFDKFGPRATRTKSDTEKQLQRTNERTRGGLANATLLGWQAHTRAQSICHSLKEARISALSVRRRAIERFIGFHERGARAPFTLTLTLSL